MIFLRTALRFAKALRDTPSLRVTLCVWVMAGGIAIVLAHTLAKGA